jgi:cyanate permease
VALGPVPFGIVYDAVGSYTAAIPVLLFLSVVATGAVLLATQPRGAADRTVLP